MGASDHPPASLGGGSTSERDETAGRAVVAAEAVNALAGAVIAIMSVLVVESSEACVRNVACNMKNSSRRHLLDSLTLRYGHGGTSCVEVERQVYYLIERYIERHDELGVELASQA